MALFNGGWTTTRIALIASVFVACGSIAYALTRDDAATGSAPAPASSAQMPQANPETTILELQQYAGSHPDDASAWQRLGWAYFGSQRYDDAARAYGRAVTLAPDNATFWSSRGEALVMASERDPMPKDAADAFDKAIKIDPKDPRARYFLAVKRDLGGDHSGALNDWLALLKDTPPGAPWEADLRRTIEQVGKINHIETAERVAAIKPASPHAGSGMMGGAAIPGPSREQMQAAAGMPPAQQDQMIQGMLTSLRSKLAANPENVPGWVMLMRSHMTLGEAAKAGAAYREAIAANPARKAEIAQEARALGVPGV